MKTEINYDVSYFISFFEAIPEHKWGVAYYRNGNKHCAVGHCVEGAVTELYALLVHALDTGPVSINDGQDARFPQPTPKARILAALYAIKSKQTPPAPTPAVQHECCHMWLEATQTCLYCCASKPLPTEKPEAVVV